MRKMSLTKIQAFEVFFSGSHNNPFFGVISFISFIFFGAGNDLNGGN